MTKTVFITGCSSGFGNLLVEAFLQKGWNVVATLRNAAERSHIFTSQKNKYSDRLHVLSLDITKPEQRLSSKLYIKSHLNGKLDCLINNAGFGLLGPFENFSEQQLRYQMEVNFFGTGFLIQDLLEFLKPQRGKIINISSLLGYHALPFMSAYCASKYALEGLSESLAYDLLPFGVQVCVVEPGGFGTRFGDNVIWADNVRANDPYANATQAFKARYNSHLQRPGALPQPVIDKIIKLSEADKVPLRVRVGKDAVLVYLLKRLLSDRILFKLQKIYFDRKLLRLVNP